MLSRLQGKPRREEAKNRWVNRLTIEPQTSCGLKEIELKNRKIQRKNQQYVTIINDWNGLPYDSVNVHSTNLFKTHLDRFYYDYQYDIV